MRKFKEGQKVYWNDPAGETSGKYEVLDPKDDYNIDVTEADIADFDSRMILIGCNGGEAEVYAEELDIICPLSASELGLLQILKDNFACQKENMLQAIKETVSQCERGELVPLKGQTYKACDENYEPCRVLAFSLESGVPYALLGYGEEESVRKVPVRELQIPHLFEIFCLIIES